MSKFLDEQGLKTVWNLTDNKIFLKDLKIQQVSQYLFECIYDDWDYELGRQYFEQYKPDIPTGACSAIRKGNFYGRNFDWYYDNATQFVIHCNATKGRHASLGVANNKAEITPEILKSGEYQDYFRIAPFWTVDGINDAGVVCNTNVCPIDKGITIGTNPEGEDIYQMMLVRYVLDYADSALDGVRKIINNCNVYSTAKMVGEELHIMIADKNSTYIVEFTDTNRVRVLSDQIDEYDDIPNGKAIMTNFHLSDWNGDVKAVFLGNSAEATTATGLEEHAMGLERYIKLSNEYNNIDSVGTMQSTMRDVQYTKSYSELENPIWYSEFVGYTDTFGELNIYNNASDYAGILAKVRDDFARRQRDGNTWQTVHSCVYDIENKHLYIYSQEDYQKCYEFDLETLGESQIMTKDDILNILNS